MLNDPSYYKAKGSAKKNFIYEIVYNVLKQTVTRKLKY